MGEDAVQRTLTRASRADMHGPAMPVYIYDVAFMAKDLLTLIIVFSLIYALPDV